MNDTIRAIKILVIMFFFYMASGFYIFVGSIFALFIVYLVTEHYISKLLIRYRDLLDDNNKIIFDAMTRDEQVRLLSGPRGTYDPDIILIRDTIRKFWTRIKIISLTKSD
jgi:hypothetical protein